MADRVDYLVRGTVVDVRTGELRDGSVAIDDGEIVALEARPAAETLDAAYVAPGLIDAHVHVESSLVTLPQYAATVIPRGVTSIIHDPHEFANVLGEVGVRAVIEDAERTPLKARFGVPSSVPASALQDTGATLDADAVSDLLESEAVVALAEVMDINGVVSGDPGVHRKIDAAREHGLTVDGHLPRVSGSRLQEAARFLDTDHESIGPEELLEKYHAGLRVYLREGSTSRNLSALVPVLSGIDTRHVSLCSDDRNPVDLVEAGGVDNALRRAIAEGVDPVEAIQLATLNTAESYDLPFGRIQPGAPADLVLLDDLETWTVDHVFIDGIMDPTANAPAGPSTALPTDTVRFDPVAPDDLCHRTTSAGGSTSRVRVIDVGELQTDRLEATVPCRGGRLEANLDDDILPAAVIERHGQGGGLGTGFVHGFGLSRGAIASTIAHDAHNLVVVGTTHAAMATIANRLRETDGGVGVVDPATDTTTVLPLPVAGLVSDWPMNEVCDRFRAVQAAAESIGLSHPGGIMELTFLALEVSPSLRLTNNGLVDVEEMAYVDVVVPTTGG